MPEAVTDAPPAVAIPVYKTALSAEEKLSIDRTVEVLGRHALYLVGPERLRDWMQALCGRYGGHLSFRCFADRFFAGIAGYNALMRARGFYAAFASHGHLLIAQTDALVLSDRLDEWCGSGFSYLGAPWLVGGSLPEPPLRLAGVGNGGFSLRRIDHFLQVLGTPRRIPNTIKSGRGSLAAWSRLVRRAKHEWLLAYNVEPLFPSSNEDVFWGVLVPAVCPFFRVPSAEQAIDFAFEVAPRWLFELNGHRLPFGCHAWERCDRDFWVEHLAFLRQAA